MSLEGAAGSRSALRVATTVEQCWHPQPGGSGTYIRELLGELHRIPGLSITGLAARHGSGDVPEGGPLPVGVRRSVLPRPALYDLWQRARRPRGDRRREDVVHATTWAIPGRRCPLVVTVHDLAFRENPAHFTRRGTAFFERGLEIVRREAAQIIVPSAVTRDDCVTEGLDPERITVVPHGVRALAVTAPQVEDFRHRHGVRRPYVLWTGTREPRKNLPTLVAAFRQLVGRGADLDLLLVGPDGWGSDAERANDVAGDRIHLLGRLAQPELHAAYAGATVFCYPSLREGYGMPVTEAMSHGLPVVTSRGTATEEAAGGAAVLVDPLDVDDVERGLVDALDPSRQTALRAASLRRASRLSWAQAAEQTAAVLRRAAGGSPA